jgi:hypothetical protein
MVLSAAAAIARRRRPRATGAARGVATPVRTPTDAVGALVAAAAGLDHNTATAIVEVHLVAHGVVATWERVCRPALAELDTAITADRGCTDAQLVLSWAVSAGLRRHAAGPAASDAQPVLLACAPREQHTLAMDALFAALSERRVPARMLGPAVPPFALIHAVQRLRPAAVVVWAQRATAARSGLLRRVAGRTDLVLAAGPGWHQVEPPAAVITVNSLGSALEPLTGFTNPADR